MAKVKVKTDKQEEVTETVVSHEECEQKLAEMKTQLETAEGKYRRALADYQNLERQVREDQSRFAKLATQLFVEQMLTPFDHLLLAARHVNDKGLDLVVAQFKQLFESQGLKEILVLGKSFDPSSMEAVGTAKGQEDIVLEVAQPGYELNGVVIRPAKVIVGTNK